MHDEPLKLSLYSTNVPMGAAPLWLATFSKPLVEIQMYNTLENLRTPEETDHFEQYSVSDHPQSTFIYPLAPTRSSA